MPDDKAAREAIIAAIEAAFDGVQLEDGISLHEANAIDDYEIPLTRAEARKLDKDTRWQDAPAEAIENLYTALFFFDAKGYRYYLPAYMVWSLRNHDTSTSMSPSSTLFSLSRAHPICEEQYLLLNDEQRRAVCLFLRYFTRIDEYRADAETALRAGWKQYCGDDDAAKE